MTYWRLQPDIYAADVGGDLVFLDAAGNQYSCLSRDDAGAIIRAFSGTAEPDDAVLVCEVMEAGLITEAAAGAPAPPGQPRASALSDYYAYAPAAPRPSVRSLLYAAFAALETAFEMGLRGPKAWFARTSFVTDIPLTRVCTLAAQFERVRPLFPKTGRCLPKSMFLLAYLRRNGIHADWVFGVQTYPFEAHCWVEYQGVVLSDTLEHVRWYTPIAAL